MGSERSGRDQRDLLVKLRQRDLGDADRNGHRDVVASRRFLLPHSDQSGGRGGVEGDELTRGDHLQHDLLRDVLHRERP